LSANSVVMHTQNVNSSQVMVTPFTGNFLGSFEKIHAIIVAIAATWTNGRLRAKP
jgi:hypothetical protein